MGEEVGEDFVAQREAAAAALAQATAERDMARLVAPIDGTVLRIESTLRQVADYQFDVTFGESWPVVRCDEPAPLVSDWHGRRFNSPNDVIVKSDAGASAFAGAFASLGTFESFESRAFAAALPWLAGQLHIPGSPPVPLPTPPPPPPIVQVAAK